MVVLQLGWGRRAVMKNIGYTHILAQWSVARIRTPAARVQSPVPLGILGMCL